MMKSSAKVSVIVPVYNAKKYLKKCLESILSQTYTNIEIILIDDASTDGSREIIQEYEAKDERIKAIYNKTNKGLASPNRNKGLDKASGDFVCFIDSDDYIDTNWIQNLLETSIDKKSDVTRGLIKTEIEEQDAAKSFGDVSAYQDYYNVLLEKMISEDKLNMRASVCYSLYSKKIIDKYKIRFDERIRNGEDELWNIQFGYYAKSIVTVDRPTYYHRRMRKGSIMTAENTTSEGIYFRALMFREIMNFMNSKKDYPKNLYINRFFDLYNMTNNATANLEDEEIAEKIVELFIDILHNIRYKKDILKRIGVEYLHRQKHISNLESLVAARDSELEFLGVKRSARLLAGSIKRKVLKNGKK